MTSEWSREVLVTFDSDEISGLYVAAHEKQHQGDAGMDLCCIEDMTIQPGSTAKIHLGVHVSPPDRRALELRCRSSIHKTPLRLCNAVGTIDANYRGELIAVVDHIKMDGAAYEIKAGDRLFQLVSGCGRKIVPNVVTSLDETQRGNGRFGSTGR